MKIKTNLRAGSGGATGTGHNGNNAADDKPVVPPTSRCTGI